MLQALVTELRKRLPEHRFVATTELVLTYPALHPAVGHLEIRDNGDELILFYGAITHAHFDNIADVVEEIKELLQDRIVLWRGPEGDGSYHVSTTNMAELGSGVRRFLWSGPINDG